MDLPRKLSELIGADAVLTAPADLAPFLSDHRRLYQGAAAAVVLPRTTEQVSRVVAFCNDARIGVVPQGGQYRLRGRSHAKGSRGHRAGPAADEPHSFRGCRELRAGRGGGLHPGCRTGSRRCGRPALSLEPGLGGQLPDRRQPRHQCRRHRGTALRNDARTGIRTRSRTGRWQRGFRSCRRCARTTPATTSRDCWSAAKARWE